jgi:hypothetical protein
MRKSEQLDPHYAEFIHALRNVGYSFEEAVADIIDNSIDAKATVVHLRFVVRSNQSVDLLIADNGKGMSESELKEAMRFGSKLENEKNRLGMFGLGLKLASIAHAWALFVVSNKAKKKNGRAWTDEGLKKGFYCEILETDEIEKIASMSGVPTESGAGTWVYWENLFRYSTRFGAPHGLCEELVKALRDYLGLHLHRFLDDLKITIDIFDEKTGQHGVPRNVEKLDPFGYGEPGDKEYPLKLTAQEPFDGNLTIRAHVWPPNSSAKEYKLPGGANKRQGLYFYRNNRLLSGGTWHGIREEDPHASLARVEVDLAVDVEREASVDVRKAMVKLTPELRKAIQEAKGANGASFAKYLKAADTAYRKAESKNPKNLPLIPEGGYPKNLMHQLKRLLDHSNTGKHRSLDYEWASFESGDREFFRIDRDGQRIILNEVFRPLFRQSSRSSPTDAALVKTLLFVLLSRSVQLERITAKQGAWLFELNTMLAIAAKHELGKSS